MDSSAQVIDGFEFPRGLSDRDQAHIEATCLYFLQGLRDLDLIATPQFLHQVFDHLNTGSPIVYLKPHQIALIDDEHPLRQHLEKTYQSSSSEDERQKIVEQVERIELFKEIVRQSVSAVDLGLIRRVQIYNISSEDIEQERWCIRLVYCLTTDQCPHGTNMKTAMSQALVDIFNHLRKPADESAPSFLQLYSAEVLQEPGDPWQFDDLHPRLRSHIPASIAEKYQVKAPPSKLTIVQEST